MNEAFRRPNAEKTTHPNAPIVMEELLAQLDEIPKALKVRWADDIARRPEEEWGRRLDELITSREQTEHTGGVYVPGLGEASGKVTTPESLRGRVITEYVASLMKNPENLVDCGQAACVFVRTKRPTRTGPERRVCYKVAKKGALPVGTRTLAEEVDFQEEAHKLSLQADVHVPSVYTYVDGRYGVIAMEYFPGVQLRKVIQNPQMLPKKILDAVDPLKPLEDFVSTFNERNLFHGDIHDGNVLINLATGELALIDFGQASHIAELESRADTLLERTVRTQSGQTIEHVVQSDLEAVKTLKAKLESAIKMRSKK